MSSLQVTCKVKGNLPSQPEWWQWHSAQELWPTQRHIQMDGTHYIHTS